MADTQQAPAIPATPGGGHGSLTTATEALLGILEPETEKPKEEEAAPENSEEELEVSEEEPSEEETEDDESEEEAEDEPSEEPDETEADEDEDPLYAVKVDGEELEIPLSELLAGYSRQSNYTKRTQALAEDRKAFENAQQQMASEYSAIQQERQQYVQSLQQVIEGSAGALDRFQSIDWEQLRAEDPIEWLSKREEYREAEDKVKGLQQQQRVAYEKAQTESQKQHQETLHQEHLKMVEALPEWGDPDKQRDLGNKIRDYAMKQGFQQEELNSLSDSRSLLVLRKSMLFDELQNADLKGKKLKNKPRVIRAGKGAEKKQSAKKQRDAQMRRLQKSGHVNDATSLFEDFVEL